MLVHAFDRSFFEPKRLSCIYLKLLIGLQVLDLISTLYGLSNGYHESNIILLYLSNFIGLTYTLVMSKAVLVGTFAIAYKRFTATQFITSASIIYSAYAIVILNNINLIHL